MVRSVVIVASGLQKLLYFFQLRMTFYLEPYNKITDYFQVLLR